MWCTRWFLPLLLLPLPTAPPYFLVLFLFSLTMHAKPCFYCIVLLTTLFVSSCYWQPFPVDSSLSSPWSENVTTFAQALKATLKSNYSGPIPTVIHAVDRCWCDFSSGAFFEPFNVSHWEYLSVRRLSNELERQHDNATMEAVDGGRDTLAGVDGMIDSQPPSRPARSKFWWLRRPFSSSASLAPAVDSREQNEQEGTPSKPGPSTPAQPLLRKEYDLRPYGVGISIDFSWS
ncbi:hypothetical protein CVT26_007570 [Gymnopilus dilepis]|uniref:Uncharacterized protein n=1 Tax=Gymnopilus dilepis TaxID=231916 RepID=A0A409WI58_9AGAR|nr:hypothetical protein CVT26_007570 [Gymnopilus dilepis]